MSKTFTDEEGNKYEVVDDGSTSPLGAALRSKIFDKLTTLIETTGGTLGYGRFRNETTDQIMELITAATAEAYGAGQIDELKKLEATVIHRGDISLHQLISKFLDTRLNELEGQEDE